MAGVVHVGEDRLDIYAGRPSLRFPAGPRWGNPFRIGEQHPNTGGRIDRSEAVRLLEEWILTGDEQRLLRSLDELRGAILGCWCARKGGLMARDPYACHGQVLLRLIERREEKAYRDGQQRLVFCGSCGWVHRRPIRAALSRLPEGTIMVTGGARGADRVAEAEASRLGLEVEVYEPEWDRHGKRAGFLRNETMLNLPGAAGVRAFRTAEKNSGPDHMMRISREAGFPGRLVHERR